MKNAVLLALLAPLGPAAGCRSAYYSTMEAVGFHKRDILVDRVEDGREEQAEAQEQFQTTLQAFQEITGFEGGDLEKLYKRLEKEYERSNDSAEAVKDRIDSIEKVAGDLFEEWDEEIDEMADRDLRARSESMLEDTQDRYGELIEKMKAAAATMDPVLVTFRDHVLFLKHNLNARAVASLKETSLEIEADVQRLIDEMQRSIQEADEFIAAMS